MVFIWQNITFVIISKKFHFILIWLTFVELVKVKWKNVCFEFMVYWEFILYFWNVISTFVHSVIFLYNFSREWTDNIWHFIYDVRCASDNTVNIFFFHILKLFEWSGGAGHCIFNDKSEWKKKFGVLSFTTVTIVAQKNYFFHLIEFPLDCVLIFLSRNIWN